MATYRNHVFCFKNHTLDFSESTIPLLFGPQGVSRGTQRRIFVACFKDGYDGCISLINPNGFTSLISLEDGIVEFSYFTGRRFAVPYSECKDAVLAFCNDL